MPADAGLPPIGAMLCAPVRAIAFLAKVAETMRAEQMRLALDARSVLDADVVTMIQDSLDEAIALLGPRMSPIRGAPSPRGAVLCDVQQHAHEAIIALAIVLETRDQSRCEVARRALGAARDAMLVVAQRARRRWG